MAENRILTSDLSTIFCCGPRLHGEKYSQAHLWGDFACQGRTISLISVYCDDRELSMQSDTNWHGHRGVQIRIGAVMRPDQRRLELPEIFTVIEGLSGKGVICLEGKRADLSTLRHHNT